MQLQKKLLSTLLTFTLLVVMALSAFAAGSQTVNPDGSTTTTTVAANSETDPITGQVTNTEKIEKDTEGTVYDTDFEKNVLLQKKETEITTTLADADGHLLKKTVSQSETGSKKIFYDTKCNCKCTCRNCNFEKRQCCTRGWHCNRKQYTNGRYSHKRK